MNTTEAAEIGNQRNGDEQRIDGAAAMMRRNGQSNGDGNKCQSTSLYVRKITKLQCSLSSVRAYQNKPVSMYKYI